MNFDDMPAMTQHTQMREQGIPLLSVKCPTHYQRLIEEEIQILGHTEGPLCSIVYPRKNRFQSRMIGEVVNFVQDFDNMPHGLERVIVHRYPHKLLFFPTDVCVGHCQYCFRPDVTGTEIQYKNATQNLSQNTLKKVVSYLRKHSEVQEVIFSGGDPLAARTSDLERAVCQFLEVPTVRWIRFHTKGPIFNPMLLDDPFLELCAKYQIRLVLHITHPYELCEVTVTQLKRIKEYGISAYNQLPLLRGINDHSAVIMKLAFQCAELGIQMLSLFVAEPIQYSATYRLRLERVFQIADEVFLQSPAWISNFRVCLDSPIGKVRREHIQSYDAKSNTYIFEREGRCIQYVDLPTGIDRATPLENLLYK